MNDIDNFCLLTSYQSRWPVSHHLDIALRDEWQREVYLACRGMMLHNGWKSVWDMGCGSGYKLLNLMGEFSTVGIEIEPTLGWLRQEYPDRTWADGSGDMVAGAPDMIICADVIEHVENPDELLQCLKAAGAKAYIFSTPDRDLVRGIGNLGPPDNPCHVREWSMPEFQELISRHFVVSSHQISNFHQGTQMIICQP